MIHAPDRTFVGFGFGAIQAGLFALEASRSGNFDRIAIAEIVPETVEAVRSHGGRFHVNVAHFDRVEALEVGPVEMLDPAVESDRARLIDAVASACEVATAVPSVRFYASDLPGSIHRILAAGLERRDGRPLVVYAAENQTEAARILERSVLEELPAEERARLSEAVTFCDTVIGKMSGVVVDPDEITRRELRTVAPSLPRAFLVESFHRILVSRPRFRAEVRFSRGLDAFEEKDDLRPFEEAKLYGHNAAHSLAAYLAARLDLERLDQLADVPGATDFVERALLEEAGAALRHRHAGKDPLFTAAGFQAHAKDLIRRMFNPFLGDLTDRVARDPRRKLGWNDRLAGTIRLALEGGLEPWRFARGAAAALVYVGAGATPSAHDAERVLEEIWREDGAPQDEAREVSARITAQLSTASGPASRLFA